MSKDRCRIVTQADNRDLLSLSRRKIHLEWPEFMLHDPVSDLFPDLYAQLPDFQFALVDRESNEPMAIGNSAPLQWSGSPDELPDKGWDWAIVKGLEETRAGVKSTLLCALQVVVFGEYKGRGISSLAVQAMKENGRKYGLSQMIAPVRPSLKQMYPLTPIDHYVTWKDEKGLPFDPWLRVHVKQGARIVKPCHESMRITGTIAEWQEWTGMSFPESGDYVIPGATMPISIDIDEDKGIYIEPNVWVHHPTTE